MAAAGLVTQVAKVLTLLNEHLFAFHYPHHIHGYYSGSDHTEVCVLRTSMNPQIAIDK